MIVGYVLTLGDRVDKKFLSFWISDSHKRNARYGQISRIQSHGLIRLHYPDTAISLN